MPSSHQPALLQEVINGLELKPGETFVDATYGGGGHSGEIKRRSSKVKVITIDRDLNADADITGNFRDLDKLLGEVRPDAILMDLGFSSDQLDNVPGLSFQRDEPLDMRLSRKGLTAADILNTWKEETIELILRGFGEERYSKKLAKAIIEARPFKTTCDLVRVVENAVRRRGRINPATRTFQALRIAVNEELASLEIGLEKAWKLLRPGGRLIVISFHSLEDRMVKNFFREKGGKSKPIVPSEEEISINPRARSAKLRIIKKNV